MSLHWIDDADHWICPICKFETGSPAKYEGCKCPKCGFRDDKDKVESAGSEKDGEKMREAIEALEQEPCEDAIDRAKLLQRSVISVPFHMSDGSVDYADMVFAADICRAEPVQPKQKIGWWVDKDVRGSIEPYCSVCGNSVDVIYHYNYCPNCGAKMEVEE